MNPRPMYWSVRRELWENRSIYIAPLVVAGFSLFAFLISTIRPSRQRISAAFPYSAAASAVLMTGFIVAVFYCLDALNGERRDRSILFWKSLPVSDRTTVLSKASIPLAVQPLLTFAIAFATQVVMLLLSAAVLLVNGVNPATLWSRLPLLQMPLVMFYGLAAHVLWFAPIYGWLLLVSAWARRASFLWAVLPFFAILIVEKLAFGTSHFASLLKYRVQGAMVEAFAADPVKVPILRLSQLDPMRFLSSPGLWAGLAFAAACLAAAVRLRRSREPA
ncbi:MAG TPA: ABC transporter permease [Thermoanaerobaculia bacterium]|jgi:ABC-2 type transport system permease protein|nr:ABC transporter permease [Thermoanaerobaculia bacterium]